MCIYRPFVLHGLRVGLEDGVGVGVGGSPPRDALSAILEVGILSHLESLRDSGDNEQTRHGDTQSDDLVLDLDTGAGTGAADHESSEEHWMKAGEREKLKTRSAAKQHLSSTERAKAVLSSRTDTLELVQRLPSLGLSLSDGLGSKLICAFLTVSDDVDAPLSILNILLRTGGHASDEACEQLAKKLLSRRRQAMARAICSLMHSRGRLCDTSFYAFLFASILSPQLSNGVGGLSDLVTSPPRGLGEQDDREREIERLRLAGGDAYGDTDRNMELRSGGWGREGDLGPDLGPGPGLASPAVAEALVLLEEVMQGVIASRKARASGTGTGDSTSEGSSEIKFLKIASNLIEILSRLGYGDQGLVAVYGAIERMKRLRTM